MKRFFALTWIIIPFFLQAQSQKLNVYFCNLKSNEGQIRVTLFAGKENYVKKTPVHSAVLAIENHEAVWEMDSVGTGEYIVAAFHDENKNGKLDLGTMGIPSKDMLFPITRKQKWGLPTRIKCSSR